MAFAQIYSTVRDELSLLNILAKKSYLLNVVRGNPAKYQLNSVQIMRNRIEKQNKTKTTKTTTTTKQAAKWLDSGQNTEPRGEQAAVGEVTSFTFNFITCYAKSLRKNCIV